jgi:hypothetical protein
MKLKAKPRKLSADAVSHPRIAARLPQAREGILETKGHS